MPFLRHLHMFLTLMNITRETSHVKHILQNQNDAQKWETKLCNIDNENGEKNGGQKKITTRKPETRKQIKFWRGTQNFFIKKEFKIYSFWWLKHTTSYAILQVATGYGHEKWFHSAYKKRRKKWSFLKPEVYEKNNNITCENHRRM